MACQYSEKNDAVGTHGRASLPTRIPNTSNDPEGRQIFVAAD